MTTPIHVNCPDELAERIGQASVDHDLALSSVIVAIIDEAFRKGHADRYVSDFMAAKRFPAKRRPQPNPWVSTGKAGYMMMAGDDAFILHRVGHPNRYEPDGCGWFVEGPGMEPTYVGRSVRDAQITASALVEERLGQG